MKTLAKQTISYFKIMGTNSNKISVYEHYQQC